MTRRRRWHLLLVAVVGAVSGAAAGVAWLRLAVLPFRGLDPSPALAVVRHLEANGGLRAADGRLLYDQIVGRGYRRGLDLGTAEGCSALWMAMALRKSGGSLVTIEIDPATAERARQNFRRAGMDDLVELRVADALEEVPRVAGEFDCVFMDVESSAEQEASGPPASAHPAWRRRDGPQRRGLSMDAAGLPGCDHPRPAARNVLPRRRLQDLDQREAALSLASGNTVGPSSSRTSHASWG